MPCFSRVYGNDNNSANSDNDSHSDCDGDRDTGGDRNGDAKGDKDSNGDCDEDTEREKDRVRVPGLHTASLLGVPASFTLVSVQGLCLAHSVLASSLALNVPLAQVSHFEGFPFLAATNFLPAAHFVTVTNATHGVMIAVVAVVVVAAVVVVRACVRACVRVFVFAGWGCCRCLSEQRGDRFRQIKDSSEGAKETLLRTK